MHRECAQTGVFLAATGGGVRACRGVVLAYNFLLEGKLIYGFVGLFTGKNPVMLVFMFLNETKAARLFERCV